MTENPRKENLLLTVLSIAGVLGMVVAIGVYVGWSHGVLASAFHSPGAAIAVLFCPPFVLSLAIGPSADADLARALLVFAIVSANAFLYAGVAAGGCFVLNLMKKGTRRQV